MVQGFGGTLTKLTKVNKKYVGLEDCMPFKDENYNINCEKKYWLFRFLGPSNTYMKS